MKHGVLGQEQFGYLEGVANADAVALRVVDDATAAEHLQADRDLPRIRPFDFLLTNAPGLDDTYWNYGSAEFEAGRSFTKFGDWVNGGVWGTVEGRAILIYYRLGKFEDVRRSAARAMKWAKDFRMDAPWSQRGENTNNLWSDSGAQGRRRRDDRQLRHSRRHDPRAVRLRLSVGSADPAAPRAGVDHRSTCRRSPSASAKRPSTSPAATAGRRSSRSRSTAQNTTAPAPAELTDALKRPFAVLSAMTKLLASEPGSDYERAFVSAAISACEDYRVRATRSPGPGYYRPINKERKAALNVFYEQTALGLYNGFAKRMAIYAQKGDSHQKHLWRPFFPRRRSAKAPFSRRAPRGSGQAGS